MEHPGRQKCQRNQFSHMFDLLKKFGKVSNKTTQSTKFGKFQNWFLKCGGKRPILNDRFILMNMTKDWWNLNILIILIFNFISMFLFISSYLFSTQISKKWISRKTGVLLSLQPVSKLSSAENSMGPGWSSWRRRHAFFNGTSWWRHGTPTENLK